MPEFVPYIEVLKQFRDFHNKVLDFTEEQLNIPDTYQSYAISQQNILKPVYKKIVDIEFETANQGDFLFYNISPKIYIDFFLRKHHDFNKAGERP